jgi:hypothetical protein
MQIRVSKGGKKKKLQALPLMTFLCKFTSSRVSISAMMLTSIFAALHPLESPLKMKGLGSLLYCRPAEVQRHDGIVKKIYTIPGELHRELPADLLRLGPQTGELLGQLVQLFRASAMHVKSNCLLNLISQFF